MPSHQLGKKPETQVMLSELRCRVPSQGWAAASSPPPRLLWPQAPALPRWEGQRPPAEGRAGVITPPGNPSLPRASAPGRLLGG